MALQVVSLKREFKFTKDKKELVLPDPNPEMSAQDVMKFYAGTYAELTTAMIEGPKVENDKAVYSMTTNAGTLG